MSTQVSCRIRTEMTKKALLPRISARKKNSGKKTLESKEQTADPENKIQKYIKVYNNFSTYV